MINNSLFDISKHIKADVNDKDVLVFAFNATGKTRLTGEFKTNIDEDGQIPTKNKKTAWQ